MTNERNPWPALWALVIGFFMILIDTTIVSIANPSIQEGLNATIDQVIWVTSAYLLGYAVPLLITGRLGDRFGPKLMYQIGLVIFTLSSLMCGLSDSLPGSGITNLIAFRAIQGIGAGLMTPQTMAVITRTFPAARRGIAMALWGAVSGVAVLVGPLLGGILVDGPGWEWIFFVNVPIGVIAFIAAQILVPKLETHQHSFDWLGVALSAVGMFLLVFGLQEGHARNWSSEIWACIFGGVAVLVLFVVWQHFNKKEPLVPLGLFRDRNFSVANGAITTVGFAFTSMFIPLVYFYQGVRGLSPTQTALMTIPTAVATLAFSRLAGQLADRVHPRTIVVPGLLVSTLAIVLWSVMISPTIAIGWLLIPPFLLGLGSSFLWAPLASTATRNLPMSAAGAGAGIYNTTRQVGGVIGSAAIATVIVNRIAAHLPQASDGSQGGFPVGGLPEAAKDGFTAAMSQTLLLPAIALFIGGVVAVFFIKPSHAGMPDASQAAEAATPEEVAAPA